MTNPFTSFAFAATGTSALITLPDRLTYIKNVKDFGAKGDGVTDDWAAITAAFNWTASDNRGTLFFPPGTYIVSQPLVFGNSDPVGVNWSVDLRGVGPLSEIKGNFADYVIFRGFNTGNAAAGNHIISDLAVTNTNAAGGGIRWGLNTGASLRNLLVTANLGINLANVDTSGSIPSQETSIENCTLSPGSNPTNSIGIMTVANGVIENCTVTGYQTGVMSWGQQGGHIFRGCRFELCGAGIAPGQTPSVGTVQDPSLIVEGCYFKNCGTGIDFSFGSAGAFVQGVTIESTNTTVFGSTPQYGIKGHSNNGKFRGVLVTGQFAQAGIDMSDITGATPGFSYEGVTVNNTGSGVNWALPAPFPFVANNQFRGCNVAPVWPMGDLPAVTVAVSSATWSGGIATLTVAFNVGQFNSPGETLNINVQGITPSGYNGVFTGAIATGTFTLTYPVANPGGSGGAGTVLLNHVDVSGTQSAKEGDCFNVSDASTATWGANPIGGGSTHAKVRWGAGGTNWTVVGV